MPVLPIFVSSTFRDFHAERDILHTELVPRLDAVLAELGARVELLDLRWGIETRNQDEHESLVLDVCLHEIDRCRPLFIALIGQRAGWVPTGARADTSGRSITEMELDKALATGSTVVAAVRDLHGDVLPGWVDADPSVVGRLRSRILGDRSGLVDAFTYVLDVRQGQPDAAALPHLTDKLFIRLKPLAIRQAEQHLRQHSDDAGADPLERLTVESRRQVVVGRDTLIDRAVLRLAGAEPGHAVLAGASGVGKTSILLRACEELERRGKRVLRVLVSASPGTSTIRGLIGTVAERGGAASPTQRLFAEETPLASTLSFWRCLMADLGPETIVALDGLDHLVPEEGSDDLRLLASLPSEGARVLASTTSTEEAALLEARGFMQIPVSPLKPGAVVEAAVAWARVGSRTLPRECLALMARQPRSGLWVRLAVTSLSWLTQADFQQAEAAAAGGHPADEALADVLVGQIRRLPDEDADLVRDLLSHAASELGDRARQWLEALALSRGGLTQDQLTRLSGADPLASSRARWLLGDSLLADGANGRLVFAHRLLAEATLADLEVEEMVALHGRLADFLWSDAPTVPREVADVAWHALLGGRPETAVTALGRLSDEQMAAELVCSALIVGRANDASAARTLFMLATMDWSPAAHPAGPSLLRAAEQVTRRGLSDDEHGALVVALSLPMIRADQGPGDRLLFEVARMMEMSGNLDGAISTLRDCAAALDTLRGHDVSRGFVLAKAAKLMVHHTRADEALVAAREVVALLDHLNEKDFEADEWSQRKGVYRSALGTIRQAAAATGDRAALAWASERLQSEHGVVAPAVPLYNDEAGARRREEANRRLTASTSAWAEHPTHGEVHNQLINALIEASLFEGPDQARKLMDRAEFLARRKDSESHSSATRTGLGAVLLMRAAAAVDASEWAAGISYSREALGLLAGDESSVKEDLRLRATGLLAEAMASAGDPAGALNMHAEALTRFRSRPHAGQEQSDRRTVLNALEFRYRLAEQMGQRDVAAEALAQAIDLWYRPSPLIMETSDVLRVPLWAAEFLNRCDPERDGGPVRAVAGALRVFGTTYHPDLTNGPERVPPSLLAGAVAVGSIRLAEVLRAEGNPGPALQAALEGVEHYRTCADLTPGSYAQDLLHALDLSAELHVALGDRGAGEATWRAALEVSDQALAREPNSAQALRTRVILHLKLGQSADARAAEGFRRFRRRSLPEDWSQAAVHLDRLRSLRLLGPEDRALANAVEQRLRQR